MTWAEQAKQFAEGGSMACSRPLARRNMGFASRQLVQPPHTGE